MEAKRQWCAGLWEYWLLPSRDQRPELNVPDLPRFQATLGTLSVLFGSVDCPPRSSLPEHGTGLESTHQGQASSQSLGTVGSQRGGFPRHRCGDDPLRVRHLSIWCTEWFVGSASVLGTGSIDQSRQQRQQHRQYEHASVHRRGFWDGATGIAFDRIAGIPRQAAQGHQHRQWIGQGSRSGRR